MASNAAMRSFAFVKFGFHSTHIGSGTRAIQPGSDCAIRFLHDATWTTDSYVDEVVTRTERIQSEYAGICYSYMHKGPRKAPESLSDLAPFEFYVWIIFKVVQVTNSTGAAYCKSHVDVKAPAAHVWASKASGSVEKHRTVELVDAASKDASIKGDVTPN